MEAERYDTIVIGGGQAGLSMGYQLSLRGAPFMILDANERLGHAWRNRWDSLRLFTPGRYDGLTGMPFPGPKHLAPSKDAMADYLDAYSSHFRLPVTMGVKVDGLVREGDGFLVTAGERTFRSDRVVVATGAFHHPSIPPFARKLDSGIVQLHSSQYKNPSQLQDGGVLIVGAGNSGADIAMEVIRTHPTWLSGRDTGHIPFRIESFKARFLIRLVRFAGYRVLTRGTPIGRKLIPKLSMGGHPLIRVKPKDIVRAGVKRGPKVVGVQGGLPVLEDGRILDVANVIWCTGFRQDFSWIDVPVLDEKGHPLHERGITNEPGLYFLGLPFQYAAVSDVITGVGRDAEYIAKHMASRAPAHTEPGRVTAGSKRAQ